ncbi:MAG: ferric reductase [Rhodomicrobiaceae bacterium]
MNQHKKIRSKEHSLVGRALFWSALFAAIAIPIIFAVMSPLLAWRSPVYIAACFAGVIGLGLLLLQPLLIGEDLPDLPKHIARRAHPFVGTMLVVAVIIHIIGLWITSPPDVIDALTFTSPTPFSNWGVVAMWSLLATTALAIFRRRLQLRVRNWRMAHSFFALVIVIGTVVHALLIEGVMETVSKVTLCILVVIATTKLIFSSKFFSNLRFSLKR